MIGARVPAVSSQNGTVFRLRLGTGIGRWPRNGTRRTSRFGGGHAGGGLGGEPNCGEVPKAFAVVGTLSEDGRFRAGWFVSEWRTAGVRDRKAACQDGLRLGGAGRPPWKQRRPEPVKVPTSGCGGRGWPPGANRAGRSAGLPPPAVLLGVIQPVADHLQLEEEVLLLVRFSGTAAVL
jgi:hypothetical protein